jgi:hypothetical protein
LAILSGDYGKAIKASDIIICSLEMMLSAVLDLPVGSFSVYLQVEGE